MPPSIRVAQALAAAILFAMAGCATSPAEALRGAWKSDDLNLVVTADSTAVWANCSYGTIPGRVIPDDAGGFRTIFDFTLQPGAAGSQPVTTRMVMEGRLTDDQLTIKLDPLTDSAPVTHVLTRGSGRPYLPCP